MNTSGRKTDAGSQVKTEGAQGLSNPQGVKAERITRSRWKRMPRDFKGWYDFGDGRGRVRCVLTAGPHGTTLAPVQIIPDSEG